MGDFFVLLMPNIKVDWKEPDNRSLVDEREQSMLTSIKEGRLWSVMQGFTSSYIGAFAIAMNTSTTLIGIISTLPDLIGSILQLSVTRILTIFRSRKRMLFVLAFAQALLWLPLLLVPYLFNRNPIMILVFATLVSTMGLLLNPIWNSLMADIIPIDERGRYFGRRNKIVNLIVFVSTVAAGFILEFFKPINIFIGFAALFGMAFISRLGSAYYLNKLLDVPHDQKNITKVTFLQFIKHLRETNYGNFTIYVAIIKFALFLSAPFYAVYMLVYLHYSYIQFMLISVASVIGAFLSMEFWGRIGDRYGSKNVLLAGGLMISIAPISWYFSSTFYFLIFIEFFSGISWSAFNLASSNFILDSTDKTTRIKFISYFNVFIAFTAFIGAYTGSQIEYLFPANVNGTSLPYIFLMSGLIRGLASIIFFKTLQEERLIEFKYKKEPLRIVTIRPSHTALGQQLDLMHETKHMDDVEEEIIEAHRSESKKRIFKKEVDSIVPKKPERKK
jgi:MFS family permease